MKEFLLFISGVFAGKLIEDNLPNLHYKNLIAAFNKYVGPLLLIAALGFYLILTKISKDKEVQKTYLILLTVIVATITLQKTIAQNKKTSATN